MSLRPQASIRVVAALDGSQDPVVVEGVDVHVRECHAQEHPYPEQHSALQGLTFDETLSWNRRALLAVGSGAKKNLPTSQAQIRFNNSTKRSVNKRDYTKATKRLDVEPAGEEENQDRDHRIEHEVRVAPKLAYAWLQDGYRMLRLIGFRAL